MSAASATKMFARANLKLETSDLTGVKVGTVCLKSVKSPVSGYGYADALVNPMCV